VVDGAAGGVGVAAVLETSASPRSAIGAIGANEVSGASRVDAAAVVAGAVGAAVAGAVAPGAREGGAAVSPTASAASRATRSSPA
jgi:hypothetical protein